MALVFFVIFPHPHLPADHAAYWLMMQVAMALGLLTTYPVNIWLVRQGVKHPWVDRCSRGPSRPYEWRVRAARGAERC